MHDFKHMKIPIVMNGAIHVPEIRYVLLLIESGSEQLGKVTWVW